MILVRVQAADLLGLRHADSRSCDSFHAPEMAKFCARNSLADLLALVARNTVANVGVEQRLSSLFALHHVIAEVHEPGGFKGSLDFSE